MQISSATIRLGGSMNNTVRKSDLTPAEIVVLQALHGQDAIIDVIHERDQRRSHNEEYERLAFIYSPNSNVSTPDGERTDIMQKLFPGAIKKLPTTLVEIGMGEVANIAITLAAKQMPDDNGFIEEESEEAEAARLAKELADMKAADALRAAENEKAAAQAAADAKKAAEDEAAFLAIEAEEIAKLNAETEEEQIARLIAEDEAAAAIAAKIKK